MTAAQNIAPAPSPLVHATLPFGNGAGAKTDKVLVNQYSGIYHCADCDYAAESFGAVFSHRSKHGTKKRAATKRKASIQARVEDIAASLAEVVADLGDTKASAEAVVSVEWKTRALAAEKSLKSLRRILGSTDA